MQKNKRHSGLSVTAFPWKVLLLIPLCSGIPALADDVTIGSLVPADIIPPPDILIPEPDAITPYAGLGVVYDSNVLRLRDSAEATARGLDGMSDTVRRATFGLALDKTISQQRVTANVNVTKVDYDRFAELDHLDKNASVNWNWHAGDHVEGNAGVNYSQGLTPFIDFHELAANIRTQTNEFVDAAWMLHPSWRVRAGLQHSKLSYDLASQQPSNNTQNQSELGLDYLARSGSTIGLQARHIIADFPIPEQDGGQLIFNGYKQNELKAKIDWLVTGKTRLHFLGGWVSRKQDQFTQRDFSGMNSRLSADWSPTGKIDVSATIWREIGAVDDLSTVYSLNHGASLASTWKYSEKISLIGQFNYVKRDFSQSTASGTVGGSTAQNDVLRNAGLTLAYNPTDKWEVRLSGVRSTQTSNAVDGGYTSNAVLLNTRYAF
jgi:exopolysaccharide biosynthesis operon protein EpsL